MADSCSQVPLPQSVDQLLHQISTDQNQPLPCADTRRKLASRGEEEALEILQKISRRNIRNLDAYINRMLQLQQSSDSSPHSKSRRLSPSPSKSACSSTTAIRLYASPPLTPQRSSTTATRLYASSPTTATRLYASSPTTATHLYASPPTTATRLYASPSTTATRLYASPLPPPPQASLLGTGEASVSSVMLELPRESGRAQLEALGELEFRKQFLILNYSGGMELHAIISAEEIRSLKDLPMRTFESRVWVNLGQRYADRQDRRTYIDWDSGKTHIYRCHVSVDGSYRFKGPYLEKKRTHLQKVLGDDSVLMVKFAEEVNGMDVRDYPYAGYMKIAREGIPVGLRKYRFFVFKDGGKEEKKKNPTSSPVKCYFIRMESEALIDNIGSYKWSNRTISEVRKFFMHAHMLSSVPKYMARFSLILSKTVSLEVELSSVKVERIKDEYCLDDYDNCILRDGKPLIHTDGTGFISEDLALLCPKNLQKGEYTSNQNLEIIPRHDNKVLETKQLELFKTQKPPLLTQFRLFNNGCAVKGTFLVNKKLPPRTMQIRDSMIKVEKDESLSNDRTANSMEIVGTSNPPKKTYLSKNLIALLSYGGVPNEYFTKILMDALGDAHGSFRNKRAALRVSMNYGDMDDNFTVARMILSGIPLEESYLQYRLSILMKKQLESLKGGKLFVPGCYYLMGTVDPTGILESNQVCIILENGHVSGKVLVYRNPGVHFGDIHLLEAIYVSELSSYVGNAKYAIFFSRKGPRSVADEIAGGDFDGDMYWISINPQLLEYFKPSEPWIPSSSVHKVAGKRPNLLSDEELEDELFKLFLETRFQPSFAMSEAADCWLALMDRFLTLDNNNIEEKKVVERNILQLIDIYYDALDAPKNGGKVEVPRELKVKMFPHYMEKKAPFKSFKSSSILGIIYDTVNSYQYEDHSNQEIRKLPSFDVEVPEPCLKKWKDCYEKYRADMSLALQDDDRERRDEAANEVIKKYKKILYEAEEFEESSRNTEEIFNEAIAIYNLAYNYATSTGDIQKCGFPWKVAGPALFKLHTMKLSEKAFVCLPSVLREVL
ncbi:hypothetical protein FNV43_RR16899 [Rhamnella rubrinervis]|uniref:RNA-dependent RNA polymerase n=1 Tax=Rhamnella rubrinervis TaxID=2594499 RepID=A0A8K0GZL9_9ROSA|nr:hypothetical protein FNV43_RR16899 [Rhamnella rubrinervis]